jgi:hypothetical protein
MSTEDQRAESGSAREKPKMQKKKRRRITAMMPGK